MFSIKLQVGAIKNNNIRTKPTYIKRISIYLNKIITIIKLNRKIGTRRRVILESIGPMKSQTKYVEMV